MQTVSLRITETDIAITSAPGQAQAWGQLRIAYDPKQSIGANLENIRVQLVGLDFDAIIIENPLLYPFSDTVVGLDHRRIDIGLALMNMFNKPVVALPTVQKIGLQQAIAEKSAYAAWHLDYYGQYQGPRNYGQEAMLTIGNGFYGLRGAYVEAQADANNYPGLYVAGMYDQATTHVAGKAVVNEDLVNLPNPQYLSFSIDHGQRFAISDHDIRDSYRSLDLKTGQLKTTLEVSLATGHKLRVQATKIADMQQWHCGVIRYQLTPMNFAGSLQIFAGIDGTVVNRNVARYNQFEQHHLDITGIGSAGDTATMTGQTKQSRLQFTIASRITAPDGHLQGRVKTVTQPQRLEQVVDLQVQPAHTYTIDKDFALCTSRETAGTLDQAARQVLATSSFAQVAAHTQTFFQKVWQDADVAVAPDIINQKLLRVNVFHLYAAAAALASGQLDASVGARGLHGEAYRGHVFWDELFVMPFYAQHAPQVAKQMLMYRYHRLPAAQKAAAAAGQKGAMYPWQSGASGDEQSQVVHLNPLTNTWDPDESSRQRHVSLAIAYNIWLYDHINHDQAFMAAAGNEMLVAIGRYWLSKTTYDDTDQRYHIAGVMGPDEFHENYPNAKTPGLTDNAYTNLMVAWLFKLLTTNQPAGLTADECAQMTKIRQQLTIVINDDGIIGQFAGYFALPQLDFDDYRKQYGDISRLDRILKAAHKTPDAYQVAKQADALMAFYLLDEKTITQLLSDMGYHLPADYFVQNLQFYLDRTTHGSTLSRIVYAALDQQAHHYDKSWRLYRQALLSDYYDIQGGTTAEGIHLGVMGATLDVAARVYAGIDLLGATIHIHPHLPSTWSHLSVTQHFQGVTLKAALTPHTITLTADQALPVQVLDQTLSLAANQPQTVTY
ncbi:glycoside hydrolase family 65 protein [Lacticaseibacillus baoqingensis]|uniref:Glycoside hydrolase family 65 protein n=1 Tax=Lacticaseibacillus baoqingensis TaxID=2486013 RepID=A0ABW4E1P1_9LACO|nr:glycosyl hydrolase family 65 protein [Lacticaseibacillus baoqingensis]